MKKKLKKNANPETILKNLRKMIDEAEEVLTKTGGEIGEEKLSELSERVQAGFDRLRDYSNEVGGRLKDYYGNLGGQVKDYYSDAEDRLRDYYEEVEERLRDRVESTDRTLRDHPYQMATVALGIGIVAGAIMRSIGRR